MRYSKRYLLFTIILALMLAVLLLLPELSGGTIARFRGGKLSSAVWNPVIAGAVNDRPLTIVIDNRTYDASAVDGYMNEDRSVMVPVSMLRDAMNAAVHVYDGEEVLVEKHNLSVRFTLDAETAIDTDGQSVVLGSPMVMRGEELYLSLNDLDGLIGYQDSFDYSGNVFSSADTSESAGVVPTRYDLRERGRVSEIRDQGVYGTCWAFAAASAMESALLPEQKELFSVDHMSMNNSFDVDQYDGGEYTMGMAYLAGWQGPVYESDDPYGDDVTVDGLDPVAHVQQMRIIDGKDFDGIKTAVFKYGGVQTSLYSNLVSYASSSAYYNKETCAYCYQGTQTPNHDVVIIGWDDNYPKENFPVELEGDGAFICQNSWGEDFGEDGIFYVSYYDTNVGTHNVVYTGIEATDNYDHIYQSDLCGWIGKLGFEKEDMFGANVFTAGEDENVVAASFYATGADTEYVFYVKDRFTDAQSLQEVRKVASGTVDRAGYYTIDFDFPVSVEEGDRFAVILYVKTPGSEHPLAIEYDSGDDYLATLDLSDGEGYISYNGRKFVNVKEKQDCNLCIKAFTRER